MSAGKARTFLFEGEVRTIAEIEEKYLTGVPRGTIYSRLTSSGATTLVEYKAWMEAPVKKAKPRQEYLRTIHAEVTERRMSREVRAKSDAITGEKGCNYCHQMRPIGRLSAVRSGHRTRIICDTCKAARSKALSHRKSTNSGGGNP